MGTSHRHTPTVEGNPNWGKASSSITNVVNTMGKAEELVNNPPTQFSKNEINKRLDNYSRAINKGYHHSIRNLINAAGGREKVSSGSSLALGHAGFSVALSFARAFSEIVQKGLNNWLKQKGYGDSAGKSCTEILQYIREYLCVDVVGMDETAANESFEYILSKFEDKISPDAQNFDDVMKGAMEFDEIQTIVDEYFGIYIYSHLSQNFVEKLENEKGMDLTTTTMEQIKEQILEDVHAGFEGHSAITIDWAGDEGKSFIQYEFNKIIYILCGNED